MTRWIALSALVAAASLSACADISTGAYQADGYGSENYDAGIYDEGGLYEPGLNNGGLDDPGILTGKDGLIDDKSL
ncbi:hypothetical protein [Azospirillum aestuarii]|uniref:hypothetical protein n=1 Tax=Azospirillum aestuarii TaxID=2802052 RepID=UPI004054BF3E